MPSIGSTTQRTPDEPEAEPVSSPKNASPGRRSSTIRRISASLSRSGWVTTSTSLVLVSATRTPWVRRSRMWAAAARAASSARSRSSGLGGTPRARPVAGVGHVTSLGGDCGPPITGRSPRGLGQQPAAHRSGAAISPPTATRGTSSPRSVAARSTRSSRGRPTNLGSMPGVAARRHREREPVGGGPGLGVEVVEDLHVVGDEADGHEHRGAGAVLGELLEVVVDVGLEPGHLRRPGPRAEHQPRRVLASDLLTDPLGHDGRGGAVLAEVGPAPRTAALVHVDRDRVGDEDQVGAVADVVGQLGERRERGVDDRLDEARVVEVGAQAVEPRRARDGGGGRGEVLAVLAAGGVRRVGRRQEARGPRHPVVAHLGDRVGEVGVPVAVAPVDREVEAGAGQVLTDGGQQGAVLVVDRRATAEQVVVLADLLEPLARDAATTRDVLQEREDVVGSLGPAERHQQQGVVRADVGGHGSIVETAPACAAPMRALSGPSPTVGSMLTAYRRILAVPGALLFSATGLVARLPISMQGLGIVLLVVDVTGSYGLAGAVAGATTIANAAATHRPGPLPRPPRPAPGAAGADRDVGPGAGAAGRLGARRVAALGDVRLRRRGGAGAAVGRHLRAGPLVARPRRAAPGADGLRPGVGRRRVRVHHRADPGDGPGDGLGPGGGPRRRRWSPASAARSSWPPSGRPSRRGTRGWRSSPTGRGCRCGSSCRWRSWRWRWARCSVLRR